MKQSRSEFITINGIQCHVRRWGQSGAPQLFLLHGWQDTSITFQFLVDSLQYDWDIIAPDWPGYGDSEWRHQQYYMQDDVIILDNILRHFSPDSPVSVVGHSYGGQVATLFSGAQPERIRKYVSIEGFGPHCQPLSAAPDNMASWLARTRKPRPSRRYPSFSALADRLVLANHRLSRPRAEFLAKGIGRAYGAEARAVMQLADPWRRLRGMPLSFPTGDFFETFLSAISAPSLWIRGDSSHYMASVFPEHRFYQCRFKHLPQGQDILIENAGHNIHHDQPEILARHIEDFLANRLNLSECQEATS